MAIFDFVFRSVRTGDKNTGGSYNMTTGKIVHPPKGSGKKAPVVKAKMQRREK